MQRNRRSWLLGMGFALAAVFTVAGCGTQPAEEEGKGTVRLAYVNWAEGVAVTHLMDVILSDLGYTVETTMADVAPIYTSIAEGNQDVMIETWLPVTHEAYYEQFGERVELISTWFDEARIGLVVPSYVEIDSIEDMNAARDHFNGIITGIDSGAGIMSTTERAIEAYGLEFELLASSGPAMTAALQNAIDNQDHIVVTGWAPHWKFSRYDIKFLEDPEGVYGATELVHAAARLGFSEEFPEVTHVFRSMKFDANQIGSLMDAMEGADGAEERAIREWIAENNDLVQSWLP